jgi:hypothetical protein
MMELFKYLSFLLLFSMNPFAKVQICLDNYSATPICISDESHSGELESDCCYLLLSQSINLSSCNIYLIETNPASEYSSSSIACTDNSKIRTLRKSFIPHISRALVSLISLNPRIYTVRIT